MNYIVIGAGAAGISAAKMLRKMEPSSEITVISTDKHVHSRCMLHKYLSHERDEKGIGFVSPLFFESNRIRWIKDEPVKSISPKEKLVYLDCGARLPYDKLLISTGASYFIPPVEHLRTASNVYGFRDLSDAQAIDQAVNRGKRVFIIGAGLVGLDAAYALLERGCDVTVAEMANRILPLQADETAAAEYQRRFEQAGCKFKLGLAAQSTQMNEHNEIVSVTLSNDETLPCDFLVVCAGVRPNAAFLEGSGIAFDRGIQVDNFLKTSEDSVYAAGDVTGLSGIWPNAVQQGELAAMNMCGASATYEDTFCIKNTVNFFGLPMLSVGNLYADDDSYEIVEESAGSYKKAIIKDGIVTGIQIQGDISNSGIWQYLIKHRVRIDTLHKPVFRLSFADFYGIDKRGEYAYSL